MKEKLFKLTGGRIAIISWSHGYDFSDMGLTYYKISNILRLPTRMENERALLDPYMAFIPQQIVQVDNIRIIEPNIPPMDTRHQFTLQGGQLTEIFNVITDLTTDLRSDPENYPSHTLKEIIESGYFFDI